MWEFAINKHKPEILHRVVKLTFNNAVQVIDVVSKLPSITSIKLNCSTSKVLPILSGRGTEYLPIQTSHILEIQHQDYFVAAAYGDWIRLNNSSIDVFNSSYFNNNFILIKFSKRTYKQIKSILNDSYTFNSLS